MKYLFLLFSFISFGQVTVTNTWNEVVRLDWAHDPDMSTYYIVKKDGIRIGKTTANRYYAHYLDEGTTYNFEVVKVNSMEVESSVGTNTATTTTGVNYNGAEPRIIDARTVSPGYSATDATTCYINAVNSANEGDIVNFAPGLSGDGKWRIGNTLGNQFQGGITSDYITINIEDGTEFNAIDGTWTSNLSMFMRFDCLRGIRVLGYGGLAYLRSSNFTGGDARMSIAFYNSAEWTVEGIELDGSGGDAIFWGDKYLGNEANVCPGFNVANERTLVYNVKALNHRRVGFGPTSMDGGQINHTHADLTGNITAQPNLFGYSFENDYPGQRLSNIHLRYGYSTAALYSGIGFNITKATSATPNLSTSFYDFVTDNNWLEDPATDVGNYGHRRDFHSSYGGGQGLIKFERTAFMNSRHAGFGATTYPNRIAFDLDDIALVNPVNDASNSTNEFHAIDFNRLTIGDNLDLGNFDINGLFIEQSKNQAWLSFRGSSSNTYELDDVGISNAMIVTPYTGGYYNPQNTPEGSNFNVAFTQQATAPSQTVSISSNADAERGGDYGNITVTRSNAAPYPTPVEITFAGTATAFDDYDFLPPVMVIPAGETSLTWPIKSRYKNEANEVVSAVIQPSNNYSVGTSSVSVGIGSATSSLPPSLGPLKAFPTAYGGGSQATGGRGQSVYRVTNLNNTGLGSFRDAVSQSNRTIVFAVSGTIDLTSTLAITASNLTIAGQTAPLGGISVTGIPVQINNANNIIIRYVRFRPDYDNSGTIDALNVFNVDNLIVDHCSISWGGDEAFSIIGDSDFGTVSNSIIGESATGMLLGDSSSDITEEMSLLGNIFYNISHRFPNANASKSDVINNLVHNWYSRLIVLGTYDGSQLNQINNYYQRGSIATSALTSGNPVSNWLDIGSASNRPNMRIYTSGNIINNVLAATENQTNNGFWRVRFDITSGTYSGTNQWDLAPSAFFVGTQYPLIGDDWPIMTASEVLTNVPDEAGANRTLDGSGNITKDWDVIDDRYLGFINSNTVDTYSYPPTGITSEAHYTSYMSSISATPINSRAGGYDSDNDGMPDVWENATFGSLSRTGTGDINGDGYTDLEDYLNLVDGIAIPPVSNPTTPQTERKRAATFTGIN